MSWLSFASIAEIIFQWQYISTSQPRRTGAQESVKIETHQVEYLLEKLDVFGIPEQ